MSDKDVGCGPAGGGRAASVYSGAQRASKVDVYIISIMRHMKRAPEWARTVDGLARSDAAVGREEVPWSRSAGRRAIEGEPDGMDGMWQSAKGPAG